MISESLGTKPAGARWRRRAAGAVLWTSLAIPLAVWVVIRFAGDGWWPTTLLVYGPRWVWALPAVAVLPVAFCVRSRLRWLPLPALVIAAGPVMGLHVSWRRSAAQRGPSQLRVLTCNADGEADPASLLRVIDAERPDVVAIQEFRGQEPVLAELGRRGWTLCDAGGLRVASRYAVESAELLPTAEGWRNLCAAYVLRTPAGRIRLVDQHLETPRKGLEPALHSHLHATGEMRANALRRDRESQDAAAFAARADLPVLIAGDFNMPCDSIIYRRHWGMYTDAFEAAGTGYGWSKFTRWWGIRIDHVLAGPGWVVRGCHVCADVGSSHRPVVADVQWQGGLQ